MGPTYLIFDTADSGNSALEYVQGNCRIILSAQSRYLYVYVPPAETFQISAFYRNLHIRASYVLMFSLTNTNCLVL
jgi:hypothetical protein